MDIISTNHFQWYCSWFYTWHFSGFSKTICELETWVGRVIIQGMLHEWVLLPARTSHSCIKQKSQTSFRSWCHMVYWEYLLNRSVGFSKIQFNLSMQKKKKRKSNFCQFRFMSLQGTQGCSFPLATQSCQFTNTSERASLVAQMVKHLPAMQETWVQCLGGENPLKKVMSTHSSILARRIPWTEEPGGLQSMVSQRVRHDRD